MIYRHEKPGVVYHDENQVCDSKTMRPMLPKPIKAKKECGLAVPMTMHAPNEGFSK